MKIITLTAFILLTTLSFAQTSSFTIFNNNGQQFFVIMNGIRQNSIPQTNVKISGMNLGAYEVKLIFADGKTGDINKKFYLDTIADFQARVVFKGKKGKLQWYGMTTSGIPSGGTNIQYRPNDQSVYSDQSSTQSTSGQGTVQQGGTQTYGGQGTVQQSGGQGTMQTQGGTASSQGQYGGQGSMTTSTNVSDPSMSGSGTMTTTTTVSDPSMTGTGGMTTSTSVTDPTTGGTGSIGMTTTVTDPTMNGGTGSMGTTMTVTDPNNPNLPNGQAGGTININVNMNMSDPNLNGGQGNFGTTTTVTDGQESFGSTTTTTGNGMTTTTTTSSSSSTTTTTTTGGTTTMTQNGTWGGNGQQGNVTYGDEKHGGEIVSTNGTPPSGYSCTTIMTDVNSVVAKINKMTFDDDKRAYIEKDLKSICVTSDQAYKIVNALTFAEDRLDMCKFFYDRMTDKVNGSRLLELLTFEMDQDEFKTYMSTH